VKGIELEEGDSVVSMAVVEPEGTLLTVTDRGFGKRSRIEDYRLQTRGGKGIINVRTTDRNGRVVAVPFVHEEDEVMVITAQGMILRMRVKDVAIHGRATQGVRLIELGEGDHVVGVAKLAEKDEEETD
jgi:DNA gyrase subunit A